jgi:Flp pilus assembly protein TadD
MEVCKMHLFLPLVSLALLSVSACSVFKTDLRDTGINEAELISGTVLFAEPVSTATLDDVDILAISEEMREFVRQKTDHLKHADAKLSALVNGMINNGLLTLEYNPNLTYSAIETYKYRQGNCMSFSSLFAALAREAGLKASFQLVDIPPNWVRSGDMVLLNNHINILVTTSNAGRGFKRVHVIDFNAAEFRSYYASHPVSDDYVLALYFSNLAVEALDKGDLLSAFRFIKKALEENRQNAGIWVNLGVLYSRQGYLDHARAAYIKALDRDRTNKSAMVNLAMIYKRLNEPEKASYYRDKVAYYQSKNPYYHFNLARSAYAEAAYEDALLMINKAIKIKRDEYQFYFLRGSIYEKLGDTDSSRENMDRAIRLAVREKQNKTYMR